MDASTLESRLAPIRALAAEHKLRAVILSVPATLSWLFSARWNVPLTLDSACFDVIVEADPAVAATIVVNSIEAPRLRDTELAGLPVRWSECPWTEDRRSLLPSGQDVGSDAALPERRDLSRPLAQLRRSFDAVHQELLADVSADAAAAVGSAALTLTPGMTEHQATARVAHELLVRGMDPVCLFTGADGRGERHRHPLPTAAVARKGFMLVCCARRHGLIASVTRHVSFEVPEPAALDAYHRLLLVEKAFLDASAPGTTLGTVVDQGFKEYGRQGFDPAEWQRHHQGGLSGVTPREYPAVPASSDVISAGSVLAWNPSAGPWKVEDTSLVTPTGLRTLVQDAQWPTIEVGGRVRPGVLVLN